MKNKLLATGLYLLVLLLCIASACEGGDAATTAATGTTATTTETTTAQTTAATTTATGNTLASILGLGANRQSIKYDMTVSATGEATATMTIWQKNNKMRQEMNMGGMTAVTIYDMDEGVLYNYMPEQHIAYKVTVDKSMLPVGSVGDTSEILDYHPNTVGTESIAGMSCMVIEYSMPGTGSIKQWIWTETGFPLKTVTTAGGITTTVEYSNIDFSDIPDSIFELPEDVEIISM